MHNNIQSAGMAEIHNNCKSSDSEITPRRAPKIYTKTGDLGYTSLLGCGGSVPKWDKKIRAYGAVDELNSHLGQVREVLIFMKQNTKESLASISTGLIAAVTNIQQILFISSSWLSRADYKATNVRPVLNELKYDFVEELEESIDQMTDKLPVLKNFILLAGAGTSTVHVARSVCRRAESEVGDAINTADAMEHDQYSLIMIYLNRLSDWLFTVARFHSHSLGQNELLVEPPKVREI